MISKEAFIPTTFIAIDTLNRSNSMKERLSLLEQAINASGSSLVITDATQPENPIIYANPAFERLTGYTTAEIIGQNCRFLQGDDTDQPNLQKLREDLRRGSECRVILRNYRKDGTLFWNQLYISPVYDATGHLSNFVGIQNDITEQVQTEEKFRQSQTNLRAIFESSLHSFVLIEPQGSIRAANQLAQESSLRVYGRRMQEGHPIRDYVHSSGLASFETNFSRALQGQSASLERNLKGFDGADNWFEVNYTPAHDETGQIVGVCLTTVGIAERKRTELALRQSEEQLRQAQKMEAIGRLAGGIAHDFNNMLTAIMGYAQLLTASLPEDNELHFATVEIDKAAQRSADLTRQLLTFSRQQVLQPKVLDLNEIITDVNKLLRRVIGENIEVVTVLGSNLGRIKADPGQLEQVIMNLVVNARDAMSAGGQLTIETANFACTEPFYGDLPPGSYVVLSVSDTGYGIDEETQSHIFEPFYTTKEVGKGTGLGLAMVYGIVQQSGGTIKVESQPGHGATFKVYFPKIEEALTPASQLKAATQLSGGSETILLVEDEDILRSLAHRLLVRSGYRVLEARDGSEALLIARSHPEPIHLLITDMMLPQMSGWELATKLTQQRPLMKVLLMSGYTEDIVPPQDSPFQSSFIQKPFTPETLTRTIRRLLEN